VKKIKRLLYLLQLEEYQTDRYYSWLKRNNINNLQERKKQLVWTSRAVSTFLIALLLTPVLGPERAVGLANGVVSLPFWLIKKQIAFRAKLKLRSHPQLIRIVITGSYGKTTFKEMLAWALEGRYSVLKTPENINTQVGIAKMLLKDLRKDHQVLIVEAGAYQEGEIKEICRLVRPDFGIVTIIGLMHLERFKTQAKIREAKLEIVPFIKNKKRLFIPKKNDRFIDFQKTVLAVADQLGLSGRVVNGRLRKFLPPKGRLRVRKAGKNLIILDDSYNSNPLGFKRALKKLAGFKSYQKIVVTPGMIEFGRLQNRLNSDLAQLAAEVADIIVIVGETNKKSLTKGVKKAKNRPLVLFSKAGEGWDQKISAYLRPPSVILLENDLPDHYF